MMATNADNIENAGSEDAEVPCERALELLARLNKAGAEADSALIQEIIDHFDHCTRCLKEEEVVEELVSRYRASGSSNGPDIPSGLEQRLLEAVCGKYSEVSQASQFGGLIQRETIMNTNVIENKESTGTVEGAEISGQYGFGVSLNMPIEEAIEHVTAALKEEGFGVLTTIDVRQTMKQKLDIDFEPYYILGACNPRLAYRALETVHDIGLLLPCNVIVHAHGEQTRVEIADPIEMMGIVQNGELESIALEARSKLKAAVARLSSPGDV